ncbi:MAG: hypothetical protein ACYDCK_15195, partial [Thermoplasmatota archaeon]
ARFRGSARALPAETRLPLRVTSYRKELERTYRALVGRLALPASTTPREVERAVVARAGSLAGDADLLASTVERALFREHAVERAELVAFERLTQRIAKEAVANA